MQTKSLAERVSQRHVSFFMGTSLYTELRVKTAKGRREHKHLPYKAGKLAQTRKMSPSEESDGHNGDGG